ncbi:histidine phosphatase family protein [Lapillicoccus jejuensis]|uniref:Broad specificity phosphatase PhoE n=1 Tax=Lapillicoccus jejuensis TaxID=402171 RepID=A0A542DXN0_9MICO|nr:histidine phosphatase family protein [Lapillicoccus jejuensis]TQJ07684.1 broad specificity phosphatase PhoE [Lapillicoccus jejuensis]
MSTRTVVHLLRHGEVDNPRGVLYGRLPGYHLSELGARMAQVVADHLAAHDVTVLLASPLERAQETAAPLAQALDLPVGSDPRLIEAGNWFEGKQFGVGAGSLARPGTWPRLVNPFKPSWGEPYEEIAERMLAAVADAREAARGHEAVLVSHQLPVWTARRRVERKHLWHDPRSRECTLASLTSLEYADDDLRSVTYSEPAAALLPRAATTAGA